MEFAVNKVRCREEGVCPEHTEVWKWYFSCIFKYHRHNSDQVRYVSPLAWRLKIKQAGVDKVPGVLSPLPGG